LRKGRRGVRWPGLLGREGGRARPRARRRLRFEEALLHQREDREERLPKGRDQRLSASIRGTANAARAGMASMFARRRNAHYHLLAIVLLFAMLLLMSLTLHGHKPLPGGF